MVSNGFADPQFARRARDYWNVDGLPLLLGSVLYLMVVGVVITVGYFFATDLDSLKGSWFFESLVKPAIAFAMITSPFWVIAGLIWLALNWEDLVEWFKVRLTYPRTGYIAPPSHWRTESTDQTVETSVIEKPHLFRWLTFLGGFWFWLLVGSFWDFSGPTKARASVLGVILTIRGLRFCLFPEAPAIRGETEARVLVRTGGFFRSVFNSFWVWILLLKFLPRPTLHLPAWLPIGLALVVTALIIGRLFPKVGWHHRLGICSCVAVCGFLVGRGSDRNIALAFLIPGGYAASIGFLKLVSYLRANPLPPS